MDKFVAATLILVNAFFNLRLYWRVLPPAKFDDRKGNE